VTVEHFECRYCANTGWFYGTPDLGLCGCSHGKLREELAGRNNTPERVQELLVANNALLSRARLAEGRSTFAIGDRVRKTKGSSWQGIIVGTYSTRLTPEGYAVESEREPGSVQIYPVGALELVPDVDHTHMADSMRYLVEAGNERYRRAGIGENVPGEDTVVVHGARLGVDPYDEFDGGRFRAAPEHG
jgi:dihydrofolate reductase (trimethoprim resistance protein)